LRDGEEVFVTEVGGVIPNSSSLVTLFEYRYFSKEFFGEKIPEVISNTTGVASENLGRLTYFAAAKPDGPAPIIAIVFACIVVMLLAQWCLLVDLQDAKTMKPTNMDVLIYLHSSVLGNNGLQDINART
jgi:hypothetical protein